MPAYADPLEPVAYPGQAVRLEPSNRVFRVESLENLGRIGPVDYGAASAGASASESGSSVIDLEDELEMRDGQIGQYLINPLSRIEVEVRQNGDQDQRLINKNKVGKITPYDPLNQRLVWVEGSADISAIFTNQNTYDLQKTLVYYVGHKLVLGEQMRESEVDQMRGEPASIPVDTLKGAH